MLGVEMFDGELRPDSFGDYEREETIQLCSQP